MNQNDLTTSAKRGNIFESFVIAELIKGFYNHGHEPSVYFWQDQADHEVDCIIDLGKHVIALEIKAGRTVNKSFFDGLSHWEKVISKDIAKETYVIYGANKKQISGYKNVISWQSIATAIKI